jgi:EAL domain-containing protein (putative c-di-GMP-specific phosphodiesterase class I)
MLVCGAEALARVNHPIHGVVSPLAFIPPAHDPRHQELARFVVRQAMMDWARFADAGLPLTLSINVPVSVIQSGEFLHYTRESLPKDPRFPGLIVEMTEDEVIRDFELVREAATQLKLYGISLSIDDFGTAHSSLSRLYDCPCAELKIDRKFVQNCASDPLKRSLCLTVIDLAHRIGARVCAEGVETTEELQCLLDLDCDIAQGFLFARPMPSDRFVTAVSQQVFRPNLPRESKMGNLG